jgi:hypothetical protein
MPYNTKYGNILNRTISPQANFQCNLFTTFPVVVLFNFQSTPIWLLCQFPLKNCVTSQSVPSVLRFTLTPEYCRVSIHSVSSVLKAGTKTSNLETKWLAHSAGRNLKFRWKTSCSAEELLHTKVVGNEENIWCVSQKRHTM